jgi:hypothetical protein
VIVSVEHPGGLLCVDFVERRDGSCSFKAFRRDPEDGGRWSLTADFSGVAYPTKHAAMQAAARVFPWVADLIPKPSLSRDPKGDDT